MPFNPFLTFIALFLYVAATEEESATITVATLEGLTVRQVMRTENASVQEDMPITELVERMLAEKNAEYAVLNEDYEFRGFVTFSEIKKLSVEQRYPLKASDVIGSVDRMSDVISQGEEAIEALKRMVNTKKKVLAVEGEESGKIIGIITKRDLAMFIEMLKGRG